MHHLPSFLQYHMPTNRARTIRQTLDQQSDYLGFWVILKSLYVETFQHEQQHLPTWILVASAIASSYKKGLVQEKILLQCYNQITIWKAQQFSSRFGGNGGWFFTYRNRCFALAYVMSRDGIHFKSFRVCFCCLHCTSWWNPLQELQDLFLCPMCCTSLPKLCTQSQWSKHRHSTGAWMVSSSSGVKARFLGLPVTEASDEKYTDWPAYWKWKWWKASYYFVHHDHLFMR